MNGPGDFGRRVSERRTVLHLGVEELAARAGMDSTFVEYVESAADPELSHDALRRLSAALETSVTALTGGGMEQPPGGGHPSEPPIVESLGVEECLALIHGGAIGRVVFCDDRVPVALPVNFGLLDGHVAFLVARTSSLISHPVSDEISFEVDRIDDALTEGWSVLMSGVYRVSTDPGEVDRAHAAGIAPWAGGVHDALVTISSRKVTGRRIRRRSSGTVAREAGTGG